MDELLPPVVSVVRCSRMASVDGEQLSLNIRNQVIDPFHCVDLGVLKVGFPWALVDDPVEERLDFDVEAGIWVLGGNDTVDSRVSVADTLGVVSEAVFGGVLWVLDESGQGVGSADGVFTGND